MGLMLALHVRQLISPMQTIKKKIPVLFEFGILATGGNGCPSSIAYWAHTRMQTMRESIYVQIYTITNPQELNTEAEGCGYGHLTAKSGR